MMNHVERNFRNQLDPATGSPGVNDMCGHMEVLRQLASQCSHVTEFGVRSVVSTWAFLHGCKGKIVSYDVAYPPEVKRAEAICLAEGVDWTFIQADVNNIDIEPTDLLFLDTNHSYTQLSGELRRHADKARKYIVMHDTTTFADVGTDHQSPGVWAAIEEFVAQGTWRVQQRYTHNNGLTVLRRNTLI